MKEAFRKTEADLPTGYDILLIARNTITEAKCEDVRKSLDVALKRAGLKDQR
jgi:RNase P protein component